MCSRAMPNHSGFSVDRQETVPDPHGRDECMTEPVGNWRNDDIDGIQEPLVSAGAEVQNPIAHLRHESLIAKLSDPDGSPLRLLEDTA